MEKQPYTKYSAMLFTVLKLYIAVCAQTYIEKVLNTQKTTVCLFVLTLASYLTSDKSLILSNKECNQRLIDHKKTKDINLHSILK